MKFIKSPHKNTRSDEALIADFRETRDDTCIEILFNRYCHLVFAVAMNYLHNEEESKDTTIEIFEKLPADITRYDIKNFSNWIYIVTKNLCYLKLKKQKRFTAIAPEDLPPAQLQEISEGEETWEQQFIQHLDESLASLVPEQQICVKLFYLEEKSYEDIEKQTGYSYNQVKSYIQNGKRNLKNYLSRFISRKGMDT